MAGGWIAMAADRPVGYLLAVYVFSLEHLGLTAEIDEFYVLPEQRGGGVGAALRRRPKPRSSRLDAKRVPASWARQRRGAPLGNVGQYAAREK
jgi:GNAT superfamily N-acetyltransferase